MNGGYRIQLLTEPRVPVASPCNRGWKVLLISLTPVVLEFAKRLYTFDITNSYQQRSQERPFSPVAHSGSDLSPLLESSASSWLSAASLPHGSISHLKPPPWTLSLPPTLLLNRRLCRVITGSLHLPPPVSFSSSLAGVPPSR